MGAAERFSTATKAKAAATPIKSVPMVLTDTQPQSLPSVSARISGIKIRATRTVPATSIDLGRSGSRDSVTVSAVSGIHAAATAASIQNRPCHPVTPTRKPPTSGPSAAPTAEAAPHKETARTCAEPLFATDRRLMPDARMVAPAAPWMALPAMTIPPD